MDAFALKYGNHSITLAQSRQLIGVKPKQGDADCARVALERALPARSWKTEGMLGGFQLVSICDHSVDAGEALDKIRSDASIQVGTHVFELPERRGIFVPTGELFVEFKPGTSAEMRHKIFEEFGLSIREARGAQGYLLVVTSQSPNPVKVACGLQRKRSVCVAEPDLASNAVIKVLRFGDHGLPTEQSRLRAACLQNSAGPVIAKRAGRGGLFSPHASVLSQRAVSLLWHLSGVRQTSNAVATPSSEPACWRETFARAVRRRHAELREDRLRGSALVTVPADVTVPTGVQSPGVPTAPAIEIILGGVTIRVPVGADVSTLQAVLQAVRATL